MLNNMQLHTIYLPSPNFFVPRFPLHPCIPSLLLFISIYDTSVKSVLLLCEDCSNAISKTPSTDCFLGQYNIAYSSNSVQMRKTKQNKTLWSRNDETHSRLCRIWTQNVKPELMQLCILSGDATNLPACRLPCIFFRHFWSLYFK